MNTKLYMLFTLGCLIAVPILFNHTVYAQPNRQNIEDLERLQNIRDFDDIPPELLRQIDPPIGPRDEDPGFREPLRYEEPEDRRKRQRQDAADRRENRSEENRRARDEAREFRQFLRDRREEAEDAR